MAQGIEQMTNQTQSMGTQPLPLGHELLWYTIEEILGHGGFGMTYLAIDTNLNRKVAIKEYLPTMFACRNEDFSVRPLTGDNEEDYQWGLSSFLTEARTLAKFRHRNVVQVQTVFEAYNTAYMVMEYEHGESLDQVFKQRGGQLNQAFFEDLLFPVMDGLQDIHDAGFIHRDIKPGNLYIRSDGSPVLIDFGSARQTSQQETSEMTTLVSQGYTPIEQYSSNFGEQGPWTDIYSLAASVYHGITGSRPEDALNRSGSLISTKPDPLLELSSLQPAQISDSFCVAVDRAMKLKPEERPQSLAEWRSIFDTKQHTMNVSQNTPNTSPVDDDATRLQPRTRHAVSPVPQSAGRNTTTHHEHHQRIDTTHIAHTGIRNEEKNLRSEPKAASSIPLIIGGLLVVALGAGGWWFTQNKADRGSNPIIVTEQLLDELPKPTNTGRLPDPAERIQTEIAELRVLASVYQELLQADPNSPQGIEGISYVLKNYREIAELNLLQSSELLRGKLSSALRSIASQANTSEEVEKLISKVRATESMLSFEDLKIILDKESLNSNEQEQLLLGLSSLAKEERTKALADNRVVKLSGIFKTSIIKAVKGSQFEQAKNMTALALLINPNDGELIMIKEHLEKGT